MDKLSEIVVTIATAIVGVAILSVLVSRNSQTATVLGAAGSAFANAISAATGPVTGKAATPNVGGGSSFGGLSMPAFPSLVG